MLMSWYPSLPSCHVPCHAVPCCAVPCMLCVLCQQAQRPPPAVAESQRRAQLGPLLPLLPEGPEALLQAYKAAALSFQLHTVRQQGSLSRPAFLSATVLTTVGSRGSL